MIRPTTRIGPNSLYDLPALHRDPFDRVIVAQAIVEDLVLLTVDAALPAYGVRVLPG
jgi:PIN domain nuclease of toxin-antitoxin system